MRSSTVRLSFVRSLIDESETDVVALWSEKDGVTVLPRLDPADDRHCSAHDIDKLGEIVGRRFTGSWEEVAVLWTRDSRVIQLAGDYSGAFAINDRGQIVGGMP